MLGDLTDGEPLNQEIPGSVKCGASPSLPMPAVAFLRVRRRTFAHWCVVGRCGDAIGLCVGTDDFQEVSAVLLQLGLTHASYSSELLQGLRDCRGHVAQTYVTEDYVGRDVAGIGQTTAERAQLVEQLLIVFSQGRRVIWAFTARAVMESTLTFGLWRSSSPNVAIGGRQRTLRVPGVFPNSRRRLDCLERDTTNFLANCRTDPHMYFRNGREGCPQTPTRFEHHPPPPIGSLCHAPLPRNG